MSILTIVLRPAYALTAFLTTLLWYPSFLPVSIGTIDISASRIVVFVLLVRCLCDDKIRREFTWTRLDTLVTLSMLFYVGVPLFSYTMPISKTFENRGGFLLDTWFAYMVTRFIVRNRSVLVSVIKSTIVVLVPLAILGVIESVTHWQPFAPLRSFSPWYRGQSFVSQGRFGFARAVGPFGHAILFGCSFAMFLPLVYYLHNEGGKWKSWAYVFSAVALMGALSCMSSGGWVMAFTVLLCLALEKHRRWTKRLVIFLAVSCILLGIVSNRTFYHVIASWANPLGGAGWHRARLIDVAIDRFDEWWLMGYGENDPGWGHEFGMGFTDVTNEFILAGVRYGVVGVIALCVVVGAAFHYIQDRYKKTVNPRMKSLYWSLGSLLFAIVVTWMSVSFFGQLMPLFYCVLGTIGSVVFFAGRRKTDGAKLLNTQTRKAG